MSNFSPASENAKKTSYSDDRPDCLRASTSCARPSFAHLTGRGLYGAIGNLGTFRCPLSLRSCGLTLPTSRWPINPTFGGPITPRGNALVNLDLGASLPRHRQNPIRLCTLGGLRPAAWRKTTSRVHLRRPLPRPSSLRDFLRRLLQPL